MNQSSTLKKVLDLNLRPSSAAANNTEDKQSRKRSSAMHDGGCANGSDSNPYQDVSMMGVPEASVHTAQYNTTVLKK